MTAVRRLEEQQQEPVLRLVHASTARRYRRQTRVDQYWTFCHAALWRNEQFSPDEVLHFKQLIKAHFKGRKDKDHTFCELVERAILARRYVNRRRSRYMTAPGEWLEITNTKGLSGTQAWLDRINQERHEKPNYNAGIFILAKAILAFCNRKNTLSVVHYRHELLSYKEHELLSVFLHAIAHIGYLKQ